VLIVLGYVLAPVAVLGVWAGNEVSDTGRYVATVEPLIHDPAIRNVLTDDITKQITSQINVTGIVNQAAAQLNSRGLTKISALLSQFGPQIAGSVTGFIHSTVHSVITSQPMANAWVQVNTVAHQGLVKVLSGQGGGALSVQNGQIVLNLGPLTVVAKQDLVAHGFKLASSIPPVSPTVALFQAKDDGTGRLKHHEELGPRLDRRYVGGADRGRGPERQREVVDEPRHPSGTCELLVQHFREDERRVPAPRLTLGWIRSGARWC
jgi:hypothetical protein